MRTPGIWMAVGALGLVAACDRFAVPIAPPETAPPPLARPVAEEPSPESLELAAYYRQVEAGHRTRGLLRADGGGPDVPFDAERLARTFEALAFSREFSDVGGALVRQSGDSILHRWAGPVRIEPVFGPAVSDGPRADDGASIQRLTDRLARVTGHPVSVVDRGGNFRVLIVTEDQRRAIGPTLKRMIPEIRQREIDVIQTLDRATYCLVVASDPANNGVLTRAVAIIRAELPPLLRLSCIHEEIAQGLGLANDSPEARPSIFNDDDEFGRLTAMDELMLQLLYDKRLSPGMDAATARPAVRDIAAALTAPSF
jgi:hypothetical protein